MQQKGTAILLGWGQAATGPAVTQFLHLCAQKHPLPLEQQAARYSGRLGTAR